jgi:hypothetical protein
MLIDSFADFSHSSQQTGLKASSSILLNWSNAFSIHSFFDPTGGTCVISDESHVTQVNNEVCHDSRVSGEAKRLQASCARNESVY